MKGYKVLPSFVRVIQGDGISYESLTSVLEAMVAEKWSIDNITFGSGGALLQKLNRDTQKCAYKCCLAEIEGKTVSGIIFQLIFFYESKTVSSILSP